MIYNLTPYGRGGRAVQRVESALQAMSSVMGVFGAARRAPSRHHAASRFEGKASLRILAIGTLRSVSIFEQRASMVVRVLSRVSASGNIHADAYAAKVIRARADARSALNADIHAGKIMFMAFDTRGQVRADTHASKKLYSEYGVQSFVFAYVTAELLRYITAEIDVTIPPGGEIRLDSDAFTAFLGQANILHLYRGDWITFNRDTAVLSVEAGSGGGITGDVLYNERYL